MDQDEEEEQGLRPIGNYLSRIEHSLRGSVSTQMSKPPYSETIGQQRPLVQPSSTGQRRGGTGVAVLPSIEQAVRTGKPMLVESAVVSSLKPYVECSWRGVPTDDPRTTYAEQRLTVRLLCDRDKFSELRSLLDPAMLPAPHAETVKELARLRALTVARATDMPEMTMVLSAFAEELAEWPADAVLTALRQWPRANKFWPTLAEIIAEIRKLAETRLAIAAEIGYA